jgi:hypothetical protein
MPGIRPNHNGMVSVNLISLSKSKCVRPVHRPPTANREWSSSRHCGSTTNKYISAPSRKSQMVWDAADRGCWRRPKYKKSMTTFLRTIIGDATIDESPVVAFRKGPAYVPVAAWPAITKGRRRRRYQRFSKQPHCGNGICVGGKAQRHATARLAIRPFSLPGYRSVYKWGAFLPRSWQQKMALAALAATRTMIAGWIISIRVSLLSKNNNHTGRQ